MTTRYLTLPTAPFAVVSADTGEPLPAALGHTDVARALTNEIRETDKLDALDAFALRQKLCAAGGSVAELTDEEHAVLCAVSKRPKYLTIHAVFSPDVHAFLRAILDAPSVKP